MTTSDRYDHRAHDNIGRRTSPTAHRPRPSPIYPRGSERHPHEGRLGRYRMRGFDTKKIPHWDDLEVFMPGTLDLVRDRGYREKCETKTILGARFAKNPIELDIPVYITGMSFGALSLEAKMALAKGASMAGTATCSGEGGMIPPSAIFHQVVLPAHPEPVRVQPAPPDARRCLRVLHRAGLQGRTPEAT